MSERVLEFTEKGIPRSLVPAFQEYDIEKLDPEQAAFTIIERTLEWGDRRECRWLFERYGRERVADWFRQAGFWLLSRRRFALWRAMLEVEDYKRHPRGRVAVWPY